MADFGGAGGLGTFEFPQAMVESLFLVSDKARRRYEFRFGRSQSVRKPG